MKADATLVKQRILQLIEEGSTLPQLRRRYDRGLRAMVVLLLATNVATLVYLIAMR